MDSGPVIAADAIPSNRRPLAVGLMGSGIGLGIMLVSTVSGDLRASSGDAAWSSVYQLQFALVLSYFCWCCCWFAISSQRPTVAVVGGFAALKRMPGLVPLIAAYACFGFMYLLVLGFLTTRLEDDSGWSSADASIAYSLMGFAMIFGAPLFALLTQRLGLRLVIAAAFCLWPIFTIVV